MWSLSLYSRPSVARTLMARLPRLFRTRFESLHHTVPTRLPSLLRRTCQITLFPTSHTYLTVVSTTFLQYVLHYTVHSIPFSLPISVSYYSKSCLSLQTDITKLCSLEQCFFHTVFYYNTIPTCCCCIVVLRPR